MDTKNKIIKVSLILFQKYGLRSVSIDDICADVRISKKTFYIHFKQKEELIATILEIMRTKIRTLRTTYSEKHNAIDKFVSDYKLHQNKQYDKQMNFFFDLQKYYPEMYEQHENALKDIALDNACDFIEKGIEQGLFRKELNPKALAIVINMKFSNIFSELKTDANLSPKEILDLLCDLLIHMVANEYGLRYYKELKQNDNQYN